MIEVDVPTERVSEITSWFEDQLVDEDDIVYAQGWMPFKQFYRISFYDDYADLATLFKLALGGK